MWIYDLKATLFSLSLSDVTPSAMHVGNIVQGARLAWAQGRDIGMLDEDSDTARKVYNIMILLRLPLIPSSNVYWPEVILEENLICISLM